MLLLGARKRRRIGPDVLLAVLHANGRGSPAGAVGEELAAHPLAAVAVDDALVVDEVGRGLRERMLRHAGGQSLLFHVRQEAVEAGPIVTGRRARRGRAGGPG